MRVLPPTPWARPHSSLRPALPGTEVAAAARVRAAQFTAVEGYDTVIRDPLRPVDSVEILVSIQERAMFTGVRQRLVERPHEYTVVQLVRKAAESDHHQAASFGIDGVDLRIRRQVVEDDQTLAPDNARMMIDPVSDQPGVVLVLRRILNRGGRSRISRYTGSQNTRFRIPRIPA